MKMDTVRLLAASRVFACAQAGATSDATLVDRQQAAAQWSEDGMRQVRVKDLDLVYLRPGARIAEYHKLIIAPVSVAFGRDWERRADTMTGSRIRIRARDTVQIREELARVVRDEVARELGKSRFQVVDAPGEDVLELDVRVADLFLNAPNLPSPAIEHSYTMSFGEMTLVADLRDASTGQSVMRILDRRIGRNFGELRITTRVENVHEVRVAANAWARAVRRQLEMADRGG